MQIIEGIGIGALLLLVTLGLLFARREFIARSGGTIELSVRLTSMVNGRGWSPGIARFDGDQLRWYRVFSFAFRPRRVLFRHGLAVRNRRPPSGPEKLVLPADWVILRCSENGQLPVEIAMARTTLTGFLSWLESAPPGEVGSWPASR